MGGKFDRIEEINKLLRAKKMHSLQALAEKIETSERTIQRYLEGLDSLTSYTHRGKFVTLLNIPHFNVNGIWFCREVGFSKYGSSLETILNLINKSKRGISREELENILKIKISKQIQILIQQDKLHRVKVGSKYLYLPEEVMKNKRKKYKLLGLRQAEDYFEKDIAVTDLIDLLKAVLEEKVIDIKGLKKIARKYMLKLSLPRLERLLLKYKLTEKKKP